MSSQSQAQQDTSPHLVIDSNNRAAYIVIVTAIGLSWTLLTLIIRIVSRFHVNRSLGLEEALVIVASATAGISSACILGSVQYGLGSRNPNITPTDIDTVTKLLWLSDIFYLLTLTTAKAATLPLLTQLTRLRKIIFTCHTLAIFIAIWGILSISIIAARCHLSTPWQDTSNARCSSLYPRWVVVETFSLLIELAIFGVFVAIIHILKMRVAVKIKVIIAFSTRLPVIVPTVFRLIYLRQGLFVDAEGDDPQFYLTNAVIATQVVLHYTTMAASFAYLKPFLRVFDSKMGATIEVDTVGSSGYARRGQEDEEWSERGSGGGGGGGGGGGNGNRNERGYRHANAPGLGRRRSEEELGHARWASYSLRQLRRSLNYGYGHAHAHTHHPSDNTELSDTILPVTPHFQSPENLLQNHQDDIDTPSPSPLGKLNNNSNRSDQNPLLPSQTAEVHWTSQGIGMGMGIGTGVTVGVDPNVNANKSKKKTSRESIGTGITKTTQWSVATEVRDTWDTD